MIRHYFIAALRDLARSPLQSAIAIGSLTVGLWAAILAGIIAYNQASYDHFIQGSNRLYLATFQGLPGIRVSQATPSDLTDYLRTFPQVNAVTRLNPGRGVFSRGDVNVREDFYWGDPNFFRILRLPALYGDAAAALERPDGAVLTKSMAQKYFGRDDARGRVLTFNHRNSFTVRAVIDDLPAYASNISNGIFISGRASFSPLMLSQPGMGPKRNFQLSVSTFVQLAEGADIDRLNQDATAMVAKIEQGQPVARDVVVRFLRLDAIHLSPQMNPGARERLEIFVAIALLVLVLACLNFVSLSLARSARRAMEVGIRKAVGAGRGMLVAQFQGETVLQALLALFIAMALVEWTLPAANTFLQSGAVFAWWNDLALLAVLLFGTVLVGMAAGLYPSLVLSAFRPAPVLKGLLHNSAFGLQLRQGLVVIQFAIPLALIIAATVVFQQNRFAATEALRLDTDQMLMINLPMCGTALDNQIAALSGVAGAACSGPSLLPSVMLTADAKPRNGQPFSILLGEVGFGFFQLYHLPALEGRLPDPSHPGDAVPVRQSPFAPSTPSTGPNSLPRPAPPPTHYVINEAALAALGYASAGDAIGKPLNINDRVNSEIIGVVRDFSLYPPLSKARPAAYKTATDTGGALAGLGLDAAALHVRLKGQDIQATLQAIDGIWKQHSQDPINRIFLNDFVQQQQLDVLRQGQAFAAFAGVAGLLASLGLFGLSLSAASQRIKEIGVRKAMGADNRQIVLLLLWQFSRPVLLANLIAWPIAFWLMRRWLSGFPYHVELQWWVFVMGGAIMLLIALVTVAGQALAVARQKPVLALRYE